MPCCMPVQCCGFIQENRHRKRAHAAASTARRQQSPSKARKRPAKARKTARLGQPIGQHQKPVLGPLFKPHQNGAKALVDSMVKRVVIAQRAPARVPPASTRA